MTLIPMRLAEGPWPSLPASMEASSAQCASAGAGAGAAGGGVSSGHIHLQPHTCWPV